MRVASVIHQPDAAAGSFAGAVAAEGAELVEWNIAEHSAPELPHEVDAALVFGGSVHPDQEASHPWLLDELELLRGLVARGTPVLGVCLGAETLARALGGAVGPVARPELGWTEVELTPAGRDDPVLGALPPRFRAFQWHSYGFELPPGSAALARNAACLQAFRHGDRAWGVQFHPEVTAEIVAAWLAESPPPGAAALAARTAAELPRWRQLGEALCRAFVRTARGVDLRPRGA